MRFILLLPLFFMLSLPAQANRLNSLGLAIADAHPALRQDLARIALSALAEDYANEALQARMDRRLKKQAGLARWAREVDVLANDYRRIAEGLDEHSQVAIRLGPEGTLYLNVEGRPIAVSSPRMNERGRFEQHIVDQFCALNRCVSLPGVMDTTEPQRPVTVRQAGTRWNFRQGSGPVCETDDGLQFQFRNMDNLARKRAACAETVADLEQLAQALARRLDAQARIEWEHLGIRTLADGTEVISLNRGGDHIKGDYPALAQRRDLFRRVRPWLAARVKGTPYPFVILNAGTLLGPPEYPLE